MAAEDFQFNSTNIDSASYDPDTGALEVTFLRTGQSYVIANVTPEMWALFKSAPSPGQFWNLNFRGRA